MQKGFNKMCSFTKVCHRNNLHQPELTPHFLVFPPGISNIFAKSESRVSNNKKGAAINHKTVSGFSIDGHARALDPKRIAYLQDAGSRSLERPKVSFGMSRGPLHNVWTQIPWTNSTLVPFLTPCYHSSAR